MGDGHLNKCKECTKADANKHHQKNLEKVRAKMMDKKRHEETKLMRPTNLVPANTVNKMTGVYRTGMGDTPVYYRPGSLDFLKCKSRGMPC